MNHEIHEVHEKAETLSDIAAALRDKGFYALAGRITEAAQREAASIERVVRDAIIDYQEMYAHAPNDMAEIDLLERARRGNDWLTAHGYEPEVMDVSKGDVPCL